MGNICKVCQEDSKELIIDGIYIDSEKNLIESAKII